MWRSYPLIWKKCKTTKSVNFCSIFTFKISTHNTHWQHNRKHSVVVFNFRSLLLVRNNPSHCFAATLPAHAFVTKNYPLISSPPQRQPSTGSKKRNKKTRLKCFFIIFSCWEEALIDLKLLHRFHLKFYSFSISVAPLFRSGRAGIDRGAFLHYVSNFVTFFNPCSSFKQP